MRRLLGTVSRGIRAPIIKEGDDVVEMVVDSVLKASAEHCYQLRDKDIIGVTEAFVARSQGNYATCDQIAKDFKNKFADDTVGLIFPIASRNRFSICLKGMARGAKKLIIMFSLPADEVGNHFISLDQMDESGINPYQDVINEEEFRELFSYPVHPFTGMDYVSYYKELVENEDCECQIIFSNRAQNIVKYTKSVLCADIHTRDRSKRLVKEAGAEKVYGIDDILTESVDGSGYNPDYGLLGTNKASDEKVKLFPRDCQEVVDKIQALLEEKTGKKLEVLIYGDGAFKDPQGQIWELADPVVSPAYTRGLEGTPNEVKLKYLADNDFKDLEGEELTSAVSNYIAHKDNENSQTNSDIRLGTTPRNLSDLVGSLCDLTSGSGDKGTPIVHIQGYFDNYSK